MIYANHAYPMKREPIERWTERVEAAAKLYPVIVSEFGSEGRRLGAPPDQAPQGPDPWVVQILKVLHDHHCSWIAWDLHRRAGPCLISDWNYTPTPAFEALVKEALLQGRMTNDEWRREPPAGIADDHAPRGADCVFILRRSSFVIRPLSDTE